MSVTQWIRASSPFSHSNLDVCLLSAAFLSVSAISSDLNKAIGYDIKIETQDEPNMASVAEKR